MVVLVRALLVVPALVGASALPARAESGLDGPQLEVSSSCARVNEAQLRRLLGIEAQRDERAGAAQVSVSCASGVASLRVRRSSDDQTAQARTFAENDVAGEVGARVLSLAVVELLNDSATLKEAAPAPAEPERSKEAEPLAPKTGPALPNVRLMLAGSAYTFGFDQALAGGGISVDFLRLSKIGFRLELGMAYGSRHYDLGEAHVQLTTMSFQAGYLALHSSWSARAMLGYRFGSGRINGKAEGSMATEGTVSGACGGPLITAGLGMRKESFVAELSAEAGLVSFPLEGQVEGDSSVRLDPYWVGLSLSLGTLL
jgi:hypothetical protein